MTVQRVSSKWAKTKIILKNIGLAPYIPTTHLYSLDKLENMLETHELVYIKPDQGTYGNGVMCVERTPPTEAISQLDEKSYILRYKTKSEHFTELNHLHKAVQKICQGKEYLIQQGIRTLKYDDRPFDLRVLTQKTPDGQWESTGILGRIAAKEKIITNNHSGGSVEHFKKLMTTHMSNKEAENIRQELKNLGENVAAQLQKYYPNLKEIGLDIAIDDSWSIWILEVNTKPALFPFKKYFKNPSIYEKVKKYATAYGRLNHESAN